VLLFVTAFFCLTLGIASALALRMPSWLSGKGPRPRLWGAGYALFGVTVLYHAIAELIRLNPAVAMALTGVTTVTALIGVGMMWSAQQATRRQAALTSCRSQPHRVARGRFLGGDVGAHESWPLKRSRTGGDSMRWLQPPVRLELRVVLGLVLVGREHASDRQAEALVVEPVDPFRGGEFDIGEVAPGFARLINSAVLEQRPGLDGRFVQGVVTVQTEASMPASRRCAVNPANTHPRRHGGCRRPLNNSPDRHSWPKSSPRVWRCGGLVEPEAFRGPPQVHDAAGRTRRPGSARGALRRGVRTFRLRADIQRGGLIRERNRRPHREDLTPR
jgi:hypothetical protein